MPDATLNVGEQAETGLPARDRAAVRRPWHPSQGGAPWDSEHSLAWEVSLFLESNDIFPVVDCLCPACRRQSRR
jgi:hypothetical protein